MKAALLAKYGSIKHITFREIAIPEPEPGQVLIRVSFAGVNFPDVLISKGLYQFKPDLPFSPGGEVSGIVAKVGPDVEKLKEGDRVVAAASWGGFAEYGLFPAENCFLLPDEISLSQGAALLESYATSLHALKDRGKLFEGERLVVLGAAGGTGTAAVQIGKAMGAVVVAVASSEEKLSFARDNGADLTVNYVKEDLKASLKKIGGSDIIFDPVGGDASEQAFRSLKPNGRHLVIGFASRKIPNLPWNLPLLKSASIVGVFWGGFWRNYSETNRQNVEILLNWLKENKINPVISEEYPLDKVHEALERLEKRKVKGKILIKIS